MTCSAQSSRNRLEAVFVNVVDPVAKEIYPARLRLEADGYFLERSVDPGAAAELFLSPGWIDLHAHVYHGVGSLPIPADAVGVDTGVHLIADAGSAGEATVTGLRNMSLPPPRRLSGPG